VGVLRKLSVLHHSQGMGSSPASGSPFLSSPSVSLETFIFVVREVRVLPLLVIGCILFPYSPYISGESRDGILSRKNRWVGPPAARWRQYHQLVGDWQMPQIPGHRAHRPCVDHHSCCRKDVTACGLERLDKHWEYEETAEYDLIESRSLAVCNLSPTPAHGKNPDPAPCQNSWFRSSIFL